MAKMVCEDNVSREREGLRVRVSLQSVHLFQLRERRRGNKEGGGREREGEGEREEEGNRRGWELKKLR